MKFFDKEDRAFFAFLAAILVGVFSAVYFSQKAQANSTDTLKFQPALAHHAMNCWVLNDRAGLVMCENSTHRCFTTYSNNGLSCEKKEDAQDDQNAQND